MTQRPDPDFRERHHKAIWALIWPVRAWFQHFPVNRGKGLLLRQVILPCLPPEPAGFPYRLPSGHTVKLHYREDMGNQILFCGHYEDREVEELCRHIAAGTTVFDVGANIGMSALPFAAAAGQAGKVLAFEPHPATAQRLADNLAANDLHNVEIVGSAVGQTTGSVTFHESASNVMSSTTVVPRDFVRSFEVPLTTLDAVWENAGKPRTSALKIDVEGGELDVLLGAGALLAAERPAILLEAWTDQQREPIDRLLFAAGYQRTQPAGFEPRNFLYLAQAR